LPRAASISAAGVALSVQWLGRGLDDQNSTTDRGREVFFCLRHRLQTGSGVHTVFHQVGTMSFPQVYSGRGVNLTTHLHLVPKLRMRATIPPFPQYESCA
jgi:hypothetical protein